MYHDFMKIISSICIAIFVLSSCSSNSGTVASSTSTTIANVVISGFSMAPGVDLSGASLGSLDLHGVNLEGADLSNAMLISVNLAGANLKNANLSNAILNFADITGANLSGANLTGVLANGAKLTGSNLEGANLTNADLTQVQMSRTNMKNANLTNAKMWSTTVDLAEMDGANLKGADVYNVDFEFARVSLKGAIMPDGSVYGAVTGSTIEQGLASAITDSLVPILQSKGTVDRQCVLDAVSKLSEEELSTVATNEVFLASLSTCVS